MRQTGIQAATGSGKKLWGKKGRKNILTPKRKHHHALKGLVPAQTVSILSQCCPLGMCRQYHCDYPWLHRHQANITASCVLWATFPLITVLTSYFTVGLRRDNAHRHRAMPQTLLRRTRCNAVLRRRKKISRKLIGLLDNLASTLHA